MVHLHIVQRGYGKEVVIVQIVSGEHYMLTHDFGLVLVADTPQDVGQPDQALEDAVMIVLVLGYSDGLEDAQEGLVDLAQFELEAGQIEGGLVDFDAVDWFGLGAVSEVEVVVEVTMAGGNGGDVSLV